MDATLEAKGGSWVLPPLLPTDTYYGSITLLVSIGQQATTEIEFFHCSINNTTKTLQYYYCSQELQHATVMPFLWNQVAHIYRISRHCLSVTFQIKWQRMPIPYHWFRVRDHFQVALCILSGFFLCLWAWELLNKDFYGVFFFGGLFLRLHLKEHWLLVIGQELGLSFKIIAQ